MSTGTNSIALTPADYTIVLATPLGRLGIRLHGESVSRLDYLPGQARLSAAESQFGQRVARELDAFFHNPAFVFSLPVEPAGTPFQLRVREALLSIPSGETRTYGEVAEQLGSGARAVGNACRRNPVSILVPCHRVVSATGMGGYSGQTDDRAIWRKHWLLAHEGAACAGLKSGKMPPSVRTTRKIQRIIHA